jgi:hypothetical protein
MTKAQIEPATRQAILELGAKLLLALISVATAFLLVKLVFLITDNKSLSLISGFLFAVVPISIDTATYIKPEPLLCFLATLFIFYAYRMEEGLVPINNKSLLKLSAIIGLLMGTKYNAVLFAPVFIYLLRRMFFNKEYLILLKCLLLVLFASIVSFLLAVPSVALNVNILFDSLSVLLQEQSGAAGGRLHFFRVNLVFLTLMTSLGIPLFVFCSIGLIYQLSNIKKTFLFYLPVIFFLLSISHHPLPRLFILIIPVLIILGMLTFNNLKAWTLAIFCIVMIGSLEVNIINLGYKYQDNRRKATKYLEGLPKTTYFLLGSDAHDPRIPGNLERARFPAITTLTTFNDSLEEWVDESIQREAEYDPEIVILSTPSLNVLKREIKKVGQEDWQIFYGEKKVRRVLRKYYWGYPTSVYEYYLMRKLFETDTYKLKKEFVTQDNFFTRFVRLTHWEPEIYIYRKHTD